MDKKNAIMLIIVFILVIIVCVLFLVSNGLEEKETIPKEYKNFDVDQSLEVEICKNKDNCPIALKPVYSMISMKTENDDIKKVLDNINKETKNRYNQTKKSKFDDNKCPNAKDIYNYSYLSTLDYSLYENDEYISISINRYNRDLCLNTSNMDKPESYIYSKKDNKFITGDELRKTYEISDKRIEVSIKNVIGKLNNSLEKNYTYENTFNNGKQELIYYFDYEGNLNVYFHSNEDNSYYNSTLIYNKD
ncbi:MAG: hypothetical protein HFH46_03965 [Bacilli bacterium]|nr:hypothetical protein [Bacilli bacterium]